MTPTNKVPLVSVIIPTKNSQKYLPACLDSIREQTYPNTEIIVVDNSSTDQTQQIARRYSEKVFTRGPERSAQVNFGVEKAKGKYVVKVDSDFVLAPEIVEQCVNEAARGYEAIIFHHTPDTRVSWIARTRKFELDMYKYDATHFSARFVRKDVYEAIGGFSEQMIAGEDYDFQNKLNRGGFKTGFVAAEALHLGEPRHLWSHLLKYYDYGRDFVNYRAANQKESKSQLAFFRSAYMRHWRNFLRHPVQAFIFIIYTCLKYAFGGAGYLTAKLVPHQKIEFK
jgi:glycosyltransferase involved in cell wall biosynthesis